MREMAREELDESQAQIPALEEEIKLLLVPADPQDDQTPYSKYAAEQVATKLPSLPATSSACMPNIAK